MKRDWKMMYLAGNGTNSNNGHGQFFNPIYVHNWSFIIFGFQWDNAASHPKCTLHRLSSFLTFIPITGLSLFSLLSPFNFPLKAFFYTTFWVEVEVMEFFAALESKGPELFAHLTHFKEF